MNEEIKEIETKEVVVHTLMAFLLNYKIGSTYFPIYEALSDSLASTN